MENGIKRDIRLVGLDLDGTVFTDEKTITPATRDAIARAVRAGVAVLPVTGRPRSGLPEEVLAIPGVRYAITSNGAMCEDLAEDKVLVRLAMDEETAMRALRIAEKYDVVIDIYIDGQAYTAADSMRLVQTHVPESFRPYFLKTRRLVEDRGRFLRQTGRGAEKFTILFQDMAQRAAAWKEFEHTGLFELSGGIPENIEVNAKGVDKGRALLALAERLGLSRGQTMACGDASNDLAMLRAANVPIAGRRAVVLGRSNIVGKPMALLLLNADATVTVCHSKTRGIKEICREADILVSAVGIPKFVTADMVKEGAVVIDVGMNRDENGRLCGDADFENVKDKTSYITPVPGGVGPMTITMLLYNTCLSAFKE